MSKSTATDVAVFEAGRDPEVKKAKAKETRLWQSLNPSETRLFMMGALLVPGTKCRD